MRAAGKEAEPGVAKTPGDPDTRSGTSGPDVGAAGGQRVAVGLGPCGQDKGRWLRGRGGAAPGATFPGALLFLQPPGPPFF